MEILSLKTIPIHVFFFFSAFLSEFKFSSSIINSGKKCYDPYIFPAQSNLRNWKNQWKWYFGE